MIDPTKPVVTLDGDPAIFICDEQRGLYPLAFKVNGKVRSYTREGRYDMQMPSPLDLLQADKYTPVTFQLCLALEV